MHSFRAWLLLGALLWAPLAGAQDVRPVPPLSGRVIDQTTTLTPPQVAALEAKLAAFEAEAGPQIVVLLVPSTAPEDIASYAQRVADQWKIGRRAVGDGLLLVVAKDERAMRIEVAKALEGAVPDLAARQIIDQTLIPAFRSNDYAGGLNQAVDRLMARVRGEGLPAPAPRGGAGGAGDAAPPLQQFGLMIFVGVLALGGLLSAVLGRGPGSAITAVAAGGVAWWLGTGLLMAALAGLAALLVVGVVGVGNVLQLLLMARGGGGGGHGGGGGFSSGGGGDFGGGGASGRW